MRDLKFSLWADMVDAITCETFGDCRLRGVSLVRGVNSTSSIDLRYRPYSTGSAVTLPCDNIKLCARNVSVVVYTGHDSGI